MEQEIDESAQQFWSIYVEEAKQHDTVLTETWKSDMDSTLIFAGLFSATVTAFIIESCKQLSEDSGDMTVALLKQILAVQISTAQNRTLSLPTINPAPTFIPTGTAIAVNILWFLSLACSLGAALCVTLVQQWIRGYLQMVERFSQVQRRAEVRGVLFAGIEKWKMGQVVEFIPSLLHASLLFFFVGLCIFLGPISRAVVGAVVVIVILCISFYAFASLAPLLDPSAPYQTPLSSILWRFSMRPRSSVAHFTENGSMTLAREWFAIHPVNRNDSIQRKSQALTWVYERISNDRELEILLKSVIGLLQESNELDQWGEAFCVKSKLQTVEGRIFSFLHRTAWAQPMQQERATTFIGALLAIFSAYYRHYPRLDAGFVVEVDPLVPVYQCVTLAQFTRLGSCTVELYTKALSVSVLLAHRSLEINSRELRCPPHDESRRLSVKADTALQIVVELRELLEVVLERHSSEACNPADIAVLLQVSLAVLKSMSQDLQEWVDAMSVALCSFSVAPFLAKYSSIPQTSFPLVYRGLKGFPPEVELFAYPYQILAFFDDEGLSPDSPSWDGMLEQEHHRPTGVDTISRLLEICDPATPARIRTQNMLVSQPTSSYVDHFLSLHPYKQWLPDMTKRLATIIPIGPFSVLASILDDVSHGGFATIILDLVMAIKGRMRQGVDASVIKSILVLPRKWRQAEDVLRYRCEGSEVLFILALSEMLRWERDATAETPCPLPRDAMDFCVFELLQNIRSEYRLSVEIAERILGGLTLELSDGGAGNINVLGTRREWEWSGTLGDTDASESLPEEERGAQMKKIRGLVSTQRRHWRDKQGEESFV